VNKSKFSLSYRCPRMTTDVTSLWDDDISGRYKHRRAACDVVELLLPCNKCLSSLDSYRRLSSHTWPDAGSHSAAATGPSPAAKLWKNH